MTALDDRTERPLPPLVQRLIEVRTRRRDGESRCTLCGLPLRLHDRPLPVSFPTLVITCAGDPVKL